MWVSLINNRVLITGLLAWLIGQSLKFPLEYLLNKRWNWGILFSPGGMPSSHSALVTSVALVIGMQEGFGSPLFALAFALAVIVVYDAAGVRRQAGIHAERINELMKTFLESRRFPEGELKEVIGHTTFEVIAGILLGFLIAFTVNWIMPV
jgi:acid phosphatase family membrane protein YuiD